MPMRTSMNNNVQKNATITSILPWHSRQWEQFYTTKQHQRLPHALLLVGPSGLGKKQFAESMARSILCMQPSSTGEACGECHGCCLLKADAHPDFIKVSPETGQMIKIDQIRDVITSVSETPMQGGFRVIMITPAHAMNLAAASALLKTLEEPAGRTLFILISDNNLRLPATISSRCQNIIFAIPERTHALEWLQAQLDQSSLLIEAELLLHLADGAPVKALALAVPSWLALRQEIYQGLIALHQKQADPLQLAAQWQEHDLQTLLHLLFYWIRDIVRLQSSANFTVLMNKDYADVLTTLTISSEAVFAFLDLVQQRLGKIIYLQSLNRQLLLEELLIRWAQCYVPG